MLVPLTFGFAIMDTIMPGVIKEAPCRNKGLSISFTVKSFMKKSNCCTLPVCLNNVLLKDKVCLHHNYKGG
jgi:hypothetical protein